MNAPDCFYPAPTPRPLVAVEAQFERIAADPVPLSAAAAAALPQAPVTWGRLRELLADTSVPYEVMDVDLVWVWLIERARRNGEQAVLACAGLALPMMAATAARLARRVGDDRADAEAALLAGFLDGVARLNLAQLHPWLALRWHTFKAGRAWEKPEATGPTCVPPEDLDTRPAGPQGHPELLLAQAVAEGVIDQDGAELISETRLAGRKLVAVAADRTELYKTLAKRRRKAERRLQRWLQVRLAGIDPDRTSVVEAAALDAVARTATSVERPGERPIPRAVANFGPSQASTGCAGKPALSAHPTPAEVHRCA